MGNEVPSSATDTKSPITFLTPRKLSCHSVDTNAGRALIEYGHEPSSIKELSLESSRVSPQVEELQSGLNPCHEKLQSI